MVQGTASHVGKSVMVSALCRILRQDGFRVAPFKAQNMSNNSYVTASGGEIGRAQAAQAQAAGVEPRVEMNPILLKPEADHTSQVVLMGRPQGSTGARGYFDRVKPRLWQAVRQSLDSLREEFDVVVIEGAGSPAEINLKATEIVNMAVARYANAPVLLCGDIDRGGVFASLVGTMELLDPEERALVKGFIINKFRGDPALLTDGLTWLEQRTGAPVAGVVPYFRDIHIPEEDSVPLEYAAPASGESLLDIAVVYLPHISNFDDFDPLARENGVSLRYVASANQLGRPDLVILPGTKTTISDFCWIKEHGITEAVQEAQRNGSAVIGICGGYQMLGMSISDPHNVESSRSECEGLGLLPSSTVFAPTKETHRIVGSVMPAPGLLSGAQGLPVQGYEIHMGRTHGQGANPPFRIEDRSDVPVDEATGFDGAVDASGWVLGTYIHGLFHNAGLRRAMLHALAARKGVRLSLAAEDVAWDQEYDKLADWVRGSLDMDLVYRIAGLDRTTAAN